MVWHYNDIRLFLVMRKFHGWHYNDMHLFLGMRKFHGLTLWHTSISRDAEVPWCDIYYLYNDIYLLLLLFFYYVFVISFWKTGTYTAGEGRSNHGFKCDEAGRGDYQRVTEIPHKDGWWSVPTSFTHIWRAHVHAGNLSVAYQFECCLGWE